MSLYDRYSIKMVFTPNIIYYLMVIITFTSAIEDDLIVELPYGKIRGHLKRSYDGNDYYAFQEIPYAAPPVGKDRFKEARSPEPWEGILNANRNTKQCIQEPYKRFPLDPLLKQTEDCLYINVYSPQKPKTNSSLSVLLYIHGGAFLLGSGTPDIYNPSRFMDYNIIVVTFNYRLGVLGFLTTGDDVIPGNLGLKDQLFAMKWVNSNIHLFGGDPAKVTLSGESAGAVSVGYQLLAKSSHGLFRAALQQSGSSLGQLCYTRNARINAFNLGKALDENFSSTKSEDLLKLLLNMPTKKLVEASKKLLPADDNSGGYFTRLKWNPVLESDNATNSLISSAMHESFMNGNFIQVPVLLGFNSEEALMFLDKAIDYLAGAYDADPSLLIDTALNVPKENATILGNQIKRVYTETAFAVDKAAFVKYSSDTAFTTSMLRQAELSAQHVPIYFYQFSYMGTLGSLINSNHHAVPGAEGAGHAEEVMYLWQTVSPFTQKDILTTRRLLTLWTNFIKYLNPTPIEDEILENTIWPSIPKHGNQGIKFLIINETLKIETQPRHYSTIRNLLLKYIQPPYVVF